MDAGTSRKRIEARGLAGRFVIQLPDRARGCQSACNEQARRKLTSVVSPYSDTRRLLESGVGHGRKAVFSALPRDEPRSDSSIPSFSLLADPRLELRLDSVPIVCFE